MRAAAAESHLWRQVDLDGRRERVTECLADLESLRELLGCLVVWESGTPYRRSLEEIDRLIAGARWYVDEIEGMLEGRHPLGLVSNIAAGRRPQAHMVHGLLVQLLAGNSVIAKAPSEGGMLALTVSAAIARRSGLPISLVSGSGVGLADALVRDAAVAAVVFAGGTTGGRGVESALGDLGTRHTIEMGGVNAHGIWGFSDWPRLRRRLRAGFARGSQDPAAHTRFVVERRLLADFLDVYGEVLRDVRVGHPLLVDDPDDDPPDLDLGPLVSAESALRLRERRASAVDAGAVSLDGGFLDPDRFLPGQDMSAYVAPAVLLGVPKGHELHHRAPSGPLDTIIVVDRLWELISRMNASNGALAASIACDDTALAERVASELRAFAIGINRTRSLSDVREPYGGLGGSWKGAFTGGAASVGAVTAGPSGDRLPGNHPDRVILPGGHQRVLGRPRR